MDPVVSSSFLPAVYGAYAVVSVGLTIWLARVLGSNGALFLRDVFPGQEDLATAVNKLLVVGFYLVNLGWAAMQLAGGRAENLQQAIETLSTKLGVLLMSLAAMHFFNLFVFQRVRSRARGQRRLTALFPAEQWAQHGGTSHGAPNATAPVVPAGH